MSEFTKFPHKRKIISGSKSLYSQKEEKYESKYFVSSLEVLKMTGIIGMVGLMELRQNIKCGAVTKEYQNFYKVIEKI